MNAVDFIQMLALSLLVFGVLGGALFFAHRRTLAYYKERPHQEFRRQLIMLGLTVFAILLGIIIVPIEEGLRDQLLRLFGIIVSATIALSSTTLVGNAVAGIMLRVTKSYRPGDYIHVGDHFGRVSEMDLLHTEIQTEERDLTTLPNLYMVTHPIKTLRKSGTILCVEVSLGYDVPRFEIEGLLKEAATRAGLESPYVQIRALGDYSVTYAIAGLLTDLQYLIKKRRELRANTMDMLHEAGVEIASPAIHSLREYPAKKAFIPRKAQYEPSPSDADVGPDDLVFDKANQAENLDSMRQEREKSLAEIEQIDALLKTELDEETRKKTDLERARLERRVQWIGRQALKLEARIADSDD